LERKEPFGASGKEKQAKETVTPDVPGNGMRRALFSII
jgi:hypothetical protein